MFNNSGNFTINYLYASDGNGGNGVVLLEKLSNAACLGAGYRSDERYDAPKCYKDTRVAVVNYVMSWLNAKDSKEPIMWMSAPAGAGKSAIAQTVCEKCAEEKKLLASFFFSRAATGTGRGEGNKLVPTIACQLAIVIPETKPNIINQLENDCATLTYSMEDQLQKLVLEPLAHLKSGGINDNRTPYVVVIDGFDECNDSKVQSRIVNMISGIFVQGQVPLRFFITGRPLQRCLHMRSCTRSTRLHMCSDNTVPLGTDHIVILPISDVRGQR